MPDSFDDDLRKLSQSFLNKGVEAQERGDLRTAEKMYLAASKDDTYFAPWLNLGLIYKREQKWDQALHAFRNCQGRLPSNVSAELYAQTLWNIGISATVLKHWAEAREAWVKLQYRVRGAPGSPPSTDEGEVVLRLPDGTERRAIGIDPCRAHLPEDPTEVFVRDAQRVGTSQLPGGPRPVFPVLAVHSGGQHGVK
jgi:hypothetical protein